MQKNRIKNTFLWAGLVALTTTALLACGGGGSTPATPPAATTFVSGVVKNASGSPVQGATVTASGQSITTAADGSFKLDASKSGDAAVVVVKKSGFTTTAKEVPLATDSTTLIDIQLLADQVSTTFNAATAATIPVNGAQVQFPANAIKSANGSDYTGTVSVAASYYSPDTVQGAQAFAGPYTGMDAGVQSPIISMGFMEVKLTDAAGNPLQLKAPATLTFPAASNSADATSVPLWYYDEAASIWKREGTATRQADGTYQGTVAHFTIWNADFKGPTATIKGCFRNAAGQPISNVGHAGLRSTGWSQGFFTRDTAGTPPGDFTVLNVPAGRALEMYSTSSPAAFAPVAIPALTANETRTLGTCITATAATPSAVSVISLPTTVFTVTVAVPTPSNPATPTATVPVGTVTTPSTTTTTTTTTTATTTVPAVTGTAVFAGNYTGTYSGAEMGTFNVTINSAGVVSGTGFSQTYNLTVPITGNVTANGTVSLTATRGTAGSVVYTGTITAAGALNGTWGYGVSTGGGTYTGQRI